MEIERIVVENISKEFNVEIKSSVSALSKFLSILKGLKSEKKILALDNISFRAVAGENIGIIGRNASGKSTLLRAIAKIYQIDSGKIKTNGKLVYLTGFGQGLKKGLSMRENIFLLGSIMGLGQKDIKNRFKEIVDFADLNDFVDIPIKKFSDGMIRRLNFSIGIHCLKYSDPDILLLDETFIGGDIYFREKFVKKMEELLLGGATILFVSHDLDKVVKYCDKVIWLDKGKIVKQGSAKEIVQEYENSIKNIKS